MPLRASIKKLFAAPEITGPERARVTSMLRLMVYAGVAIAGFWALMGVVRYPSDWLRLLVAGGTALLLLSAWAVMKRGDLTRASWMIVWVILVMASFGTLVGGGADRIIEGIFIVAVIVAASLLGATRAIVVAVLCVICLASALALDSAGLVPETLVRMTAEPSLWTRGALIGFAAVVLAVSSRRTHESFVVSERNAAALERSNQELRASRDRYEALAANAHDLVAEVDEQGRYLYVNRAYDRVLGYDSANLLGHPATRATSHDSREQAEVHFQGLLDRPDDGLQRFRVLHSDGTPRFVESTSAPYRTPDGALRTTIISRDISDRVEAEREMLLLEEAIASVTGAEFFRTAVRSLASLLRVRSAFICELDPQVPERMRVRAFWEDGAFREVADYSIAGTPCEEVLREGSAHYPVGLRELWPDRVGWGSTAPLQSYSAVRLEDDLGKAVGHIGVLHDGSLATPLPRKAILRILAARSAAEIQRERSEAHRRGLEERVLRTQKLESLGLLAGGIAHDFNNLLIGIMANADEARLELSADEPARELVENISAASEGAADLVRQLLAYAGKRAPQVGPVDLSALVRDTARMLRTPGERAVVVEAELSARPVWISADRVQIRQLLMNLIANAVQALPEQGVVKLRTGLRQGRPSSEGAIVNELGEGEHAYLEVQDTGCGMDADALEQIFDPFYTTKTDGRGLGLSTVLGIVRSHCGTLKASSEVGVGTTFRILLPSAESQSASAQPDALDLRGMRKVAEVREGEAPALQG